MCRTNNAYLIGNAVHISAIIGSDVRHTKDTLSKLFNVACDHICEWYHATQPRQWWLEVILEIHKITKTGLHLNSPHWGWGTDVLQRSDLSADLVPIYRLFQVEFKYEHFTFSLVTSLCCTHVQEGATAQAGNYCSVSLICHANSASIPRTIWTDMGYWLL